MEELGKCFLAKENQREGDRYHVDDSRIRDLFPDSAEETSDGLSNDL